MSTDTEKERSIKAAEKYLRFTLGSRRACRVIEGIDPKSKEEIIKELAKEFRDFAGDEICRYNDPNIPYK